MKTTPTLLTIAPISTNLFGGLNVARAFLPYMRAKKTGTVMWMGSIGGWQYVLLSRHLPRALADDPDLRSVPYGGLYANTKWAIRGVFLRSSFALVLRRLLVDIDIPRPFRDSQR